MFNHSNRVPAGPMPARAMERGDWINVVLALVAAAGVVLAGALL